MINFSPIEFTTQNQSEQPNHLLQFDDLVFLFEVFQFSDYIMYSLNCRIDFLILIDIKNIYKKSSNPNNKSFCALEVFFVGFLQNCSNFYMVGWNRAEILWLMYQWIDSFLSWINFSPRNLRSFFLIECFSNFQYECKVQNMKKRKVTIEISVDGVRVCLKKKKRKVS